MDRFVLHELPREKGKAERSSVPIDQCVDVEGFQCNEQLSLLLVKRPDQPLSRQRAGIVLVLSRPIHFSRRQRFIVDTAHADHVPQPLAKWREAVTNPLRGRYSARLSSRVRRKLPLVLRNRARKISSQSVKHRAVPYEVPDRHRVILSSLFHERR